MLEVEQELDVTYYRDEVLKIIVNGQNIAREVYELRLTLFLRAAKCYFDRQYAVLEPFPSCFFDKRQKIRLYDELKVCISNIPDVRTIDVRIFHFTGEKVN